MIDQVNGLTGVRVGRGAAGCRPPPPSGVMTPEWSD